MSLFGDITAEQNAKAVMRLQAEAIKVRNAVGDGFKNLRDRERAAAIAASRAALDYMIEELGKLGQEMLP